MSVPDIIKQAARNLRRKQTHAEQLLWKKLRGETGILKAYRQKPILVMREDNEFERYIIADFYFPYGKIIVELDGSIHDVSEVYFLDREKENLLNNLGYHILRFTNEEVLYNTDVVLEKINHLSLKLSLCL